MRLLGRRFDTGETSLFEIQSGRIARIAPVEADAASVAGWPWIAPGLWDLQVNGYAGQAFSSQDLAPRHVADIGRKMLGFGVTRFLPTLTTERQEVLIHGLRTIDEACRADPRLDRQIAGVHLEGPYISSVDGPRGAHPPSCCREPDWDEFQRLQEAAGGRIRLLTMAVEFDSAAELIGRVAASGVLVAIGHTAADSRQIRRAVDAGARLSTHLGNGSHRILPRHPNYLWDQLAEDRLWASLIVDGHHLPPEVVKTFLRAKTPARCILVSDLASQAGLAPGRYASGLSEVEILDDGRLVVAGQRQLLAGASQPLAAAVARVMDFAGLELAAAVELASGQPARLLGLSPPTLAPGQPADLIQFAILPARDSSFADLEIHCTLTDGELRHGQPKSPVPFGGRAR
jgi:N-acetylglucosamine-6-phosphate deacetylase